MLSSPLHRATALGQLLALLIAITASTSTVLARLGLSFPTLQLVLNYSLLAVAYGYLHFGRNKNRGLSRPAWHYALLAVLDVEANFLVVTSFRFTSVTSVTFLDAWSIPVALMLTRLLALATYKRGHYVGAALCVLGLGLLVVTDKHGPQGEATAWSSNALLGDVLVVLGATLYGAGNVLQEHLLGKPGDLFWVTASYQHRENSCYRWETAECLFYCLCR